MKEAWRTEADERYLAEIDEDCRNLLGPRIRLLGLERDDSGDGVRLVASYRVMNKVWQSEAVGDTAIVAHGNLRLLLLRDRIRMGLTTWVERPQLRGRRENDVRVGSATDAQGRDGDRLPSEEMTRRGLDERLLQAARAGAQAQTLHRVLILIAAAFLVVALGTRGSDAPLAFAMASFLVAAAGVVLFRARERP